jgi:8-oxo-dGTP pyrophosphatase MutT (NUDIX family)
MMISPAAIRERLREYHPKNVSAPNRIPAAVLVPFFELRGELFLLFTKRTGHLQHHSGEICFPGGSKEPQDNDLLFTALRELQEEISVPGGKVDVLGRIDDIITVSSAFVVTPYVGFLQQNANFLPNESEVEEILQVPFQHFFDPSIFQEEVRMVDQRNIPVYYYQWQNHTIWGLTARILKTLMDILR